MKKFLCAFTCLSTATLAMQSPEPFRPTVLCQTTDKAYVCLKIGEHTLVLHLMDPEEGIGKMVGRTIPGDNAGMSPNGALFWVSENRRIHVYEVKTLIKIASVPGNVAVFSNDNKQLWVETTDERGNHGATGAYTIESTGNGCWQLKGLSRYCSGLSADIAHTPCDSWAM